ncbi:hypothetical protein ACWCQK_39875, partial [Streptomyces sp. NPDC002306]
MPGTFAFTAHRGSFGCQVRNSQKRGTCYGIVRYNRQVRRRVAEQPGDRPARRRTAGHRPRSGTTRRSAEPSRAVCSPTTGPSWQDSSRQNSPGLHIYTIT